jgi:hypothetical protein
MRRWHPEASLQGQRVRRRDPVPLRRPRGRPHDLGRQGLRDHPSVTLHYYVAYRNAAANGPCGGPGFAFNTTNGLSVPWVP